MRHLTAFTLSLCLLVSAGMARADVYGYVDDKGIAHFATEKLDERYQLFARGDFTFDANHGAVPTTPAAPLSPALGKYLGEHPNLKKFEPLLQKAAKDFGLQPALLKAIMAAESGFNPTAVSPKGAVGLMQIMPGTAERYGLQGDKKQTLAQKLTDPKTNIRISARYLRDLQKLFPGQPELVMASYNAGEGAVQKYRNTIPPYAETRNYVKLVSQFFHFYRADAKDVAVTAIKSNDGSRRLRMTIPAPTVTVSAALD